MASESFQPYIPASAKLRELTPLPLIAGTLIGMVFGASSLYLVLKVGITVSASIPVAVISITLFRILSQFGRQNATILENNIVQTAGSAGESIAFGVGVTMPAILILGFDLEFTRVMLVAVLGGLLGILMMIPLRRALIVQQHGLLKYPEGTACAEVLKAGASDESRAAAAGAQGQGAVDESSRSGAKIIFTGFGIGLLYNTLCRAFMGWKDTVSKAFGAPFKGGSVAAEISPELLGVGYIIGPRVGGIMCAGGVLSYLVLIPLIKYLGENLTEPLAPATSLIRDMSPNGVRGAYILYIGAGAVAMGGIISLLRSLPTIWHGLKEGLRDFQGGAANAQTATKRTDQDLSMKFVLIGILGLVGVISLHPALHMNLLGALLIIAFGFLFVTVSSRITGEIGSTSNPISGMTVATLLLTCLIFLLIGWTQPSYYITALSVGGIVCIAASNGGTTSQDLKTGFLIGATPKLQQIAILIGALGSALVMGPILLKLNDVGTVYLPRVTLNAPATKDVTVPAAVLGGLPVYKGEAKPAVEAAYRQLTLTPANTNTVPGLPPGDYLVNTSGIVTGRLTENYPASLRTTVAGLKKEKIRGPQAASDGAEYYSWHSVNADGSAASKYLVNDQGVPMYLVDPGINGLHTTRPDGSTVAKFEAPKATLMSYIIKGILDRKLPWGLVLIGAMIAITFEMSGLSSLAFAVGVYLPLSSTTPIFLGGMLRGLVDWYLARKHAHAKLTPEQLAAEGDKSPGVLLASGYIAGGALAGIIIAFMAGGLSDITTKLTNWAEKNNPMFAGPYSDVLALIPFTVIAVLLYLVGREIIWKPKAARG